MRRTIKGNSKYDSENTIEKSKWTLGPKPFNWFSFSYLPLNVHTSGELSHTEDLKIIAFYIPDINIDSESEFKSGLYE